MVLIGKNAQQELKKKYEDDNSRDKLTEIIIDNSEIPKKEDKWDGNLVIKDYPKLTKIDFTGNLIDELVVRNCPNVVEINLNDNEFKKVNLSELTLDSSGKAVVNESLKNFYASYNESLSEINLKNCKAIKEIKLSECGEIKVFGGGEDFEESLKEVSCDGTSGISFVGTSYLKKLKGFVQNNLGISNLDNSPNLPQNQTLQSLINYFNQSNQTINPSTTDEKIKVSTRLPIVLKKEIESGKNLEENYSNVVGKYVYDGIYPKLHWKLKKDEKIPFKLYNIETNQVEKTEGQNGRYAILSYVWGRKRPWEEVSAGGNKSLKKAVEAIKTYNKIFDASNEIKYLWVDQHCIDQKNQAEKKQELPKMGQYYSNAEITLISIQTNLGKEKKNSLVRTSSLHTNEIGYYTINNMSSILSKIVRSEWFTRSWTFQEGLLSKQTIFMFDDCLIDGRFMAVVWELSETGYGNYATLDKLGKVKIATLLGWAYYEMGYDSKDKANLSLNEALESVKGRGRTVSQDGIYSILGLLPFKVEEKDISYKITPVEALLRVMKVATENGYGDLLSWEGWGNEALDKCWLPIMDTMGSSSIKGGIKNVHCSPKSITFKESGIEVEGTEYEIIGFDDANTNSSIDEVLGKKVKVRSNGQEETLTLIRFTLSAEVVEKMLGDTSKIKLFVPNRSDWKSEVSFALMLEEVPNSSARYRTDLVRLLDWPKNTESKKILIGQEENQQVAQIQVNSERK